MWQIHRTNRSSCPTGDQSSSQSSILVRSHRTMTLHWCLSSAGGWSKLCHLSHMIVSLMPLNFCHVKKSSIPEGMFSMNSVLIMECKSCHCQMLHPSEQRITSSLMMKIWLKPSKSTKVTYLKLTLHRNRSLSSTVPSTLTPDSLDWSNLLEKKEVRKSRSECQSTKMNSQTWRNQLNLSHIQEKFIWMPCILVWGNAAFKLLMSAKPLITQDTSMICFFHSLVSWLPFLLLDQSRKVSSQIMIFDGQL